jgi:hypothetical protein
LDEATIQQAKVIACAALRTIIIENILIHTLLNVSICISTQTLGNLDEATIQQAKVIACAALHAIIIQNSAFGVGAQGETGVITGGKAVREGMYIYENIFVYICTYTLCIYTN